MKYLMVITLSIASILSAAADNLKYAPHNFSVLPPSPEVESLNRYIGRFTPKKIRWNIFETSQSQDIHTQFGIVSLKVSN